MSVYVSDIVAAIHQAFPPSWAEPWDCVGLLVGDARAIVTGVRVALDPTQEEISAARASGANVLVTHHPAFLETPHTVTAASGTAGLAYMAASLNVALISAHTNLDRAPDGAASLPRALGLVDGSPLETGSQPVDFVVVYAPLDSVEAMRSELERAGAGRIGEYSGCSFSVDGEARFTPGASASPHSGVPGQAAMVTEARIEAVAPRGQGDRIAALVAEMHPYQEPLITVAQGSIARGVGRLGRVCELDSTGTLETLVALVVDRLSCVPRVWGAASAEVSRVACATGSGGSLIDSAIAANCDVLIAGEVRYHDALNAIERGLCIIEAGHDVTEWPLVPVLASAVRATPGIDSSQVSLAPSGRGWWTP